MPSGVDSNTLNIRIDPLWSIPFFQKNVMVSSLVFENSTLLNLTNAIERSGSEKYFKPIFDIWEGYKVDFFSRVCMQRNLRCSSVITLLCKLINIWQRNHIVNSNVNNIKQHKTA